MTTARHVCLVLLLLIPATIFVQNQAPETKPAPSAPVQVVKLTPADPDFSQEAFIFESMKTTMRFEADGKEESK